MVKSNASVTVRYVGSVQQTFREGEAVLGVGDAPTVGTALRRVCTTPDRERRVFTNDDALRQDLLVMVNGRSVNLLDGLDTRLRKGDVVSVLGPVAGG